MKINVRQELNKRKGKISRRLKNAAPADDSGLPVFGRQKPIHEISKRIQATARGGIGAAHQVVVKSGLVDGFESGLEILKIYRPYHESDHILRFREPNGQQGTSWCDKGHGSGTIRSLSNIVDPFRRIENPGNKIIRTRHLVGKGLGGCHMGIQVNVVVQGPQVVDHFGKGFNHRFVGGAAVELIFQRGFRQKNQLAANIKGGRKIGDDGTTFDGIISSLQESNIRPSCSTRLSEYGQVWVCVAREVD